MADEKISEGAVEMNAGEVVSPGNNGNIALQQNPEPSQTFSFTQDPGMTQQDGSGESVEWVASEFILHEKDSNWYLFLAAVAVVIAGVIYFITKDFISSGVILFGAVMFGVYASRKPRQLPFRVDDRGVQIGQKSFMYQEFRGFSVVQEGAFSSIVFSPLKRFSPLTTIYYPPEQEEKIVSIIAHLPIEERKQDAIDKLMHLIGF